MEAIQQRMAATNPVLYRDLALYLQVLREILGEKVQLACFHLATQVHGQRYIHLPEGEREHLHRRLMLLVERCRSLLTVEQLASLAAQLEREQRRRPPSQAPREGPPSADADLPTGSVRLDLSPPTAGTLAFWDSERQPLETLLGGPGGPEHPGSGEEPSDAPEEALEEASLSEEWPFSDGSSLSEGRSFSEDPEAPPPSPWSRGDLPKDPPTLLRWIDGIEAALVRRLRNLSHAINVELARTGLSQGLLPVHLLQAVLDGQLDPDSAPPNLLRLQLPFHAPGQEVPLQAMAVLLRGTDLELEEPRLRTCRRRLQQHRQEVLRMARQFRLLQRRLQAREAERLWLQDIRTMSPGGD